MSDLTDWLDNLTGGMKWGPPTEEDVLAMAAALRAVADLHRPDACWADRLDCGACSSYDECVQWPCPTITAVTEALGEGGNDE